MVKKKVLVLLLLISTLAHSAYGQSDPEVYDPLEPMNRGIFWFNDTFDVYLFEPVARGYDDITPKPVQAGVGNFFNNLRYPVYLVSDLIQLKFTQMAKHTGRFLINTTVGVVGIFDIASDWGLPDHEEDIGLAMAYYGVPPGPYIVLPFLGPSNLRDTVGYIGDSALNPFYWLGALTPWRQRTVNVVNGSQIALKSVDTRAGLLEAVKTAKESSVDYYLFMQGAYYQYRRGVLYDGNPPDLEDEMSE